MIGTLDDKWRSYERAVVPHDASPVQRQEMRRAFYGGCWAALCLLTELGEPEVSEVQGVEKLELLMQECKDFNFDVQSGRA